MLFLKANILRRSTFSLSRRSVLLVAFGCFAFAAGMQVLLRKPCEPALNLKITRHTVEQGKPVVYLQLQGTNNGAICMHQVAKVGPFKSQPALESIEDMGFPAADFWAPSQTESPIDHQESLQREFGVLVPTNLGVWRLQVELLVPNPHSIKRLTSMPSVWRVPPNNWPEAIAFRWNFPYTRRVIVESEPITNQAGGTSAWPTPR